MTRQLLCGLLLLLVVQSTNATTTGLLGQELFSLRCSGELFFMKGTPAEVVLDLSGMASLVDKYFDAMLDKIKSCDNCPALTKVDLMERVNLGNVYYWLNYMLGTEGSSQFMDMSTCPSANQEWEWDRFFDRSAQKKLWTLPASAQLTSAPLFVKVETNINAMDLGVAGGSCGTNSPLPWFSFHCLGDSCDHVGAPCENNGECGGLECRAMEVEGQLISDLFPNDTVAFDFLTDAYLYNSGTDSAPGCLPFSSMVNRVANLFRSSWFGLSGTTSVAETKSLKFCIPLGLPNFTAVDFQNITDYTLDLESCNLDAAFSRAPSASPTMSPTVSMPWQCPLSAYVACSAPGVSHLTADLNTTGDVTMMSGKIILDEGVSVKTTGGVIFSGAILIELKTSKSSCDSELMTSKFQGAFISGGVSQIIIKGSSCIGDSVVQIYGATDLTFSLSCCNNNGAGFSLDWKCDFNVGPCQCPFIKSWDGAGAVNVAEMTSAQPQTSWETVNADPSDPNALVMMHMSCAGQLSFHVPLLGFNVRAKFPGASDMAWVDQLLYDVMKCRRGGTLDRSMFEIASMYPAALFAHFDANAAFTTPDIQAFWQQFVATNISTTKVIMPDTCNYQSWSQQGRCAAQFTGLSNLLGTPFNLRMNVGKCSSSPFGADLYVDCSGAGCQLMGPPIDCSASASVCPVGTYCRDFAVDVGNATVGFEWPWTSKTSNNPSRRRSSQVQPQENRRRIGGCPFSTGCSCDATACTYTTSVKFYMDDVDCPSGFQCSSSVNFQGKNVVFTGGAGLELNMAGKQLDFGAIRLIFDSGTFTVSNGTLAFDAQQQAGTSNIEFLSGTGGGISQQSFINVLLKTQTAPQQITVNNSNTQSYSSQYTLIRAASAITGSWFAQTQVVPQYTLPNACWGSSYSQINTGVYVNVTDTRQLNLECKDYQGPCKTDSSTRAAYRQLARSLHGQASDAGTALQYCFINEFWDVPGFDFDQWAQAQTSTQADVVTLHTIVSWVPGQQFSSSQPTVTPGSPTKTPTSPPTPAPSQSSPAQRAGSWTAMVLVVVMTFSAVMMTTTFLM